MNNILNNKINFNITKIIGEYLLPIRQIKDYFHTLKYKTSNINLSLYHNDCLDYDGFYLQYDLKHTEIRHFKLSNDDYWTIRKLKN